MPMHLAILASQCQLGSVCNASLSANLPEYRRRDKMLAARSLGRRRSRAAILLPRITSWLAVLMEISRGALPSNLGRSIMYVHLPHLGNDLDQAYVQRESDGANPTLKRRRSFTKHLFLSVVRAVQCYRKAASLARVAARNGHRK